MLNQTLKFIKSDPELTSCALLLPYLPLPFHKLSHLSSWWLHTCSCSWKKTVVQSPFTLHIQSISELIWLYHDYDRLWPLLSSSTATKLPSLHFWLIKRVCPLPHPISLLLSLLKTSLKAIIRLILVKFKSFPQSIHKTHEALNHLFSYFFCDIVFCHTLHQPLNSILFGLLPIHLIQGLASYL